MPICLEFQVLNFRSEKFFPSTWQCQVKQFQLPFKKCVHQMNASM